MHNLCSSLQTQSPPHEMERWRKLKRKSRKKRGMKKGLELGHFGCDKDRLFPEQPGPVLRKGKDYY